MIRASPLTVAPPVGERPRPSAPHRWWRMQRRCRRSVHNVLMLGPPGGGEVEAGSELTTILPALTLPEAIKARPFPHVAGRTSGRPA
jgi:hypothetical protein